MKTANLIINWLLFDVTCHLTERPLSPFDQIGRQGDKLFSELAKIWKSRLFKNPNFPSLLQIGENLEICTAPDQHFKIPMLNLCMGLENLCPNLSVTVENKMENSHKRGWSHFKLNINDWDIPFPKSLRIYQWIGKNIFHWGKWNEPIKLIRECVRLKIKI